MKKLLTLALTVSAAAFATASAAPVTLTYWQYDYASKVSTMTELIKKFEAANPGIKIKQETFPYDAYNQKVASSVPAGQGPDVVNLYYGWLPQYVDSGYLLPLPAKDFPIAKIESDFVPMVQTSKIGGKYYTLPTSVRTLAIFYNKDLFKAARITPPRTWEDFIAAGEKIVKGTPPRFTTLGFGIQPDGQDYHMVREVLVRQFGGQPYSKDGKTVTYDSDAGRKAMTFYTDLATKYKLGVPNFFPGNNSYRDAFIAGKVGMIVDGSFAINTIKSGAKFEWGVIPMPVFKANPEVRSNFGSYWVNGITKNAKGEKLDAAVKFLKFLTSEQTQRTWLENVGEIPASRKLSGDPALRKDPVFGAFVGSLPFAHSTLFVDEAGQRKAWVDAINTVLLKGTKPADAIKQAASDEQKILNSYYK